jgi:hypothetical protein
VKILVLFHDQYLFLRLALSFPEHFITHVLDYGAPRQVIVCHTLYRYQLMIIIQ